MARVKWVDGPIKKKINGGYEQEREWHTPNWDENGNYVGQWQYDMISEDADGMIFIGKGSGVPIIEPLTKEEMEKASHG